MTTPESDGIREYYERRRREAAAWYALITYAKAEQMPSEVIARLTRLLLDCGNTGD